MAGSVNPLDVMVCARYIKPPIRGIGEHDLLFYTEFLSFEVYPFVWGTDDVVFTQRQVSLDGYLLVKAGFFDSHYVGDGT